MVVQQGLCRTWSEMHKIGFVEMQFIISWETYSFSCLQKRLVKSCHEVGKSYTWPYGFALSHLIFINLFHKICQTRLLNSLHWGAPWPSDRVSDSGARGWGFDTYLCHVVSLCKETFTPLKVLVIPRKRWLRPNMTE